MAEIEGHLNTGNGERALILESQQGSRAAIDALLQRHLPALRVFVRLRLNDFLRAREEEMDVAQSVCRELLDHLSGFDYQGEERFRNWLYVAVLNKIREKEKYYRAEKRDCARELPIERASAIAEAYDSVFTPSQFAMGHERGRVLEAAFDRLPEHYREVITLAKVMRLSQKEIADSMNRSLASVRNLLSRALVRLSAILDESDGATAPPR